MIGDHLSSNQEEINEHIVEFYKKLFTEQCRWMGSPLNLFQRLRQVGWNEILKRKRLESLCQR
jgi:hypothetical protein